MWEKLEKAGRVLASYPMEALNYEFPPLFHATGKAGATVILKNDGTLKEVILHDKPQPIIFPVTEDSMKRTSQPETKPHPLSEQLGFLLDPYTTRLSWWAKWVEDRHGLNSPVSEFLWAVLAYVTAGTVQTDVEAAGGNAKTMIRWQVGDVTCWNSEPLMESWIEYYGETLRKTLPVGVDQVTGKEDILKDPKSFPKAILPGHGNGKFISAADETEFTWRGFFAVPQEALTVSVPSSHYAHQALKYLAQYNGLNIGNGDTLILWAPDDPTAKLTPNLWRTDEDNPLPFAWSDGFLENYMDHVKIPEHLKDSMMVTMICGGATTGRNSTKYYEEGKTSAYLDNIARWRYKTGWEIHVKGTPEPRPFFPSIKLLIDMAFGSMMKNKRTASDGITVVWTKRLHLAMLNDKPLPEHLIHALVSRCVTAGIYEHMIWPTTLAALRKHYIDTTGEVYNPMLDTENLDRNYLFGRLLAWYEAFEKASFNPGEERLTTAERRRGLFMKNPLTEAYVLEEKSKIWKRKLNRYNAGLAAWYSRNIQEMWNTIGNASDQELEPSFLFGYNAMKKTIYTKREDREN